MPDEYRIRLAINHNKLAELDNTGISMALLKIMTLETRFKAAGYSVTRKYDYNGHKEFALSDNQRKVPSMITAVLSNTERILNKKREEVETMMDNDLKDVLSGPPKL